MSFALPFAEVNKLHKMLLNLLSQAWMFHCRAADSVQSRTSPVDEVWNTLTAVLNFGVLKRIQTPHSLLNFILGFLSR